MNVVRIPVGSLQANCYLLDYNSEKVIIDPGADPERVLSALGGAPCAHIVLTHYHDDHVQAALAIKKAAGGILSYHKYEQHYMPFDADRLLSDGDIIGKGLAAIIHTPGHTPGSICLSAGDCIFTGDTLFEGGYGRTDLPGGSEKDLAASLSKLAELARPETVFFPGHGKEFRWF